MTFPLALAAFLAVAPLAESRFFVMDTAFGDLPWAEIKATGFEGVSLDINRGLPLKELDAAGLRLDAIYAGIDIDTGAGSEAVARAMDALKGRPTIVWVTLSGAKLKPSDPSGDEAALARLRPLAEKAREAGLKLAIYPHVGFWAERVEDAVRVADRLDRPEVGVTFNLCHFLKKDKPENLETRLKAALPRLFVVTINGADTDGTDWDRLIQPLDRGSFDVRRVLRVLQEGHFAGPIGVQGFGVPGDKKTNLERSMRAWNKLSSE